MIQFVLRVPAALALSAVLLAGCGGSGPGAATGPASGGGTGKVSLSDLKPMPGSGGGATRLTIVLPADPDPQPRIWDEAARREASRKGVVYSRQVPAEGESQADLVRRLGREGAKLLLVVPEDPEEIGPALAEVAAKGVKAITIRDPVPTGDVEVPTVVRGELGPAADEVVAAAVTDAPLIGRSAVGPALVLYSADFPESDERAGALFASATSAGIELIGDGPLPITGGPGYAEQAIRKTREEHPDLGIVLAGDDGTFRAAINVRNSGEDADRFIVAGFVVDPMTMETVDTSFASAAGFVDEQVLAIFGVRNAVELAGGGAVPDRIVTPLPVRRAPGPPAAVPPPIEPEIGSSPNPTTVPAQAFPPRPIPSSALQEQVPDR